MFKVNVVAVGRVKEKYFSEAIAEYQKRLGRFCDFKIIEVKEQNFVAEPTEAERSEIILQEGRELLKRATGKIIALTPEGGKISSEKFARLMKSLKDEGGEPSFLIGGSYGLSDEVKTAASLKLSFSDLTFPHTLFRVVLTEQIYRAFTIIAGADYHK